MIRRRDAPRLEEGDVRRFLGFFFAVLALAALGWDVWRGPFQDEPLAFTSTAEYWQSVNVTSLIGLNSFIEKNLSTDLWDYVVLPAITWPACALAGGLAIFFFLIAGRRRPKSREGANFPRNRK